MVRTLSPEKRTSILNAALKLFVANGVRNTTTAEIAKAAGIAAGTLFLYFPTKQALMDELILKIGKQQSDNIYALLQPAQSARQDMSTIWHASIGWFLENPDAYQYAQQVREPGAVSESVTLESARFFGFYYAAIQKGLQEGSLKPYPVDLIGAFLYQDIIAAMNILCMQTDPAAKAETIQTGFAIFWDGIKSEK
jgi:AcrR family transcriptional regulator